MSVECCLLVFLPILHDVLFRVAGGDDGGGLGPEAAAPAVHAVHPGHGQAGQAVEHEEEDEADQPALALVPGPHLTGAPGGAVAVTPGQLTLTGLGIEDRGQGLAASRD